MDYCNLNKNHTPFMASEINKISDCDELFCNRKDFRSLRSSLRSSTTDHQSNIESIAERLRKLPKVKARPNFDQKMAAAFAMELERETLERNRSWLKKNQQISLPDTTSDLIKDLF